MCQGVQRSLFMRLVLVCELELAVALLRERLVNALGLRLSCEVKLLCTLICTRDPWGKDFSFPAQCSAHGVHGVIVVVPRWEPKPQD